MTVECVWSVCKKVGENGWRRGKKVRELAASKGLWDDEMQRDLPKKWERHGDMIVFPQNSFTHNNWRYI
ncbi:hypothetical protein OSTOST_13513, partial [Ostertagia ostertagi]